MRRLFSTEIESRRLEADEGPVRLLARRRRPGHSQHKGETDSLFDSSARLRSSAPSIHGGRGHCRPSWPSDWPTRPLRHDQRSIQSPWTPPSASFICRWFPLHLAFSPFGLYIVHPTVAFAAGSVPFHCSSNPAASGAHAQPSFVDTATYSIHQAAICRDGPDRTVHI